MLAIDKLESEVIDKIGNYLKTVESWNVDAICKAQETIKTAFASRNKELIIAEINKYPLIANGFIDLITLMNFEKKEYIPIPQFDLSKFIPVVHSYVDTNDSLVFIDKPIDYENAKKLCREVIKENNSVDEVESSALPFVITSNFEEDGLITAQIFETKKPLQLVKQSETRDGVSLMFFGDRDDFLPRKKERRFVVPFYFYRMRQKDREFVVLSQEEIDPKYYHIKGMKVPLLDNAKVGESLKIPNDVPFIFLLKATPQHTIATEQQTWDYAKGKTLADWAYRIRGNYMHPIEFEKFLLAFMFSGKFQDFPLSIAWVAPPGTGKSRIIEAIQSQIKEDQEIFSGSQSTGLGLVPNYGGATYDEGHLLACRRIALVDEFTTSLFRHRGSTDAQDVTARMTEILEHKLRVAVCGKGQLRTKPRARVMFVMNPQPLSDLMEMSKHFNRAFMSRILWYVQTPQHIEFVENRKDDLAGDEMVYPKQDPMFISILDYLQSFCMIKGKDISCKIVAIVKKNQQYVPSELIDTFYKPRAIHHVGCLLDGIAKVNSLLEQRGKFEITDKDVQETDELFSIIVQSWNPKELTNMPIVTRRYYLKDLDRKIFEWICQAVNPTKVQVANAFGKTEQAIAYHLDNLKEVGLVTYIKEQDDTRIYPYWHIRAREVLSATEVYTKAVEDGKCEEL